MKVTQTKILDRNCLNDENRFKILLATDLIEHFQPLFYEEIRKKQRVLRENKSEVVKLKESMSLLKEKLLDLDKNIVIEKIRKNIFSMITQIINEGRNDINIKDFLEGSQSQNIDQIKDCFNKLDLVYKASSNKTKVN